MAEVGRAVPSAPQARPGALDYYMRKSAQSAKIFGTPPERGHSCPQQLPNTQQDRNVRELYFRSTLLRTRMSALRFGSGSAGLGTARPTCCYSAITFVCGFDVCSFLTLLARCPRISMR